MRDSIKNLVGLPKSRLCNKIAENIKNKASIPLKVAFW